MKVVPNFALELAQTAVALPTGPAAADGDEVRLARGDQVGRYVVLGQIGEGGMSVVYAAYDPELDRKVALKFMRPRAGGSKGYGRQTLIREAQALARVVHANVLNVFDVGTYGDSVFLALELIEGTTLAEWVDERARPWTEVLELFRAAGRGLAAAHLAGLVHRDFKPENVLVGRDGRIVVCDFGLAYRPDQGEAPGTAPAPSDDEPVLEEYRHTLSPAVSTTGQVFGTPQYMSPEQHLGQSADARSDQFAFAVALYEALYGHRPFPGKNVAQVAASVTAGRLQAPADDQSAPIWLWRVLSRALRVAPAERFDSMDQLLAALAAPPVEVAAAPLVAARAPRAIAPLCARRLLALVAALLLFAGGALADAFGGVPGRGAAAAAAVDWRPVSAARVGKPVKRAARQARAARPNGRPHAEAAVVLAAARQIHLVVGRIR